MRRELAEAAPLARAVAPVLCTEGCADYHGAIEDLRSLDLVVTPDTHAGFYRDALGARARAGARDVLIAGCADFGMLATVCEAFAGAVDEQPTVSVLDLCPTPLLLCRWWAATRPLAIETIVADATAPQPAERWDLITTESLLTLLTPDGRRGVAGAWRDSLRPGGAVVTSCRLQPGGGPEPPSEDRAAAFERRVLEEVEAGATLPPGLDGAALGAAARRFALSVEVWPVASESELVELVEGAGLEVESLDLWEDSGLMSTGQAAAGARRRATYARLVAIRA